FTDVVNANGLESGTDVVMKEGRIQIVADGDVAVSGTLSATGGPGVNGGEIAVRAGGNVALEPGATLVAHGEGEASSGGTVDVWAEGDAVARAGALVDASAGTRGDGGAIEFSARRTVELAGGEFRADGAGGGKGGAVLVDPETIKVSAHHLRGTASYASGGGVDVSGADITLQADKAIEVDPGIVISSRAVADPGNVASHVNGDSTGSSGDITLEAPEISLGAGSMLLADAQGAGCAGCSAGDIRLEAAKSHGAFDLADLETRVAMSNATLRGRDIVVKAQSTYNSLVLPVAVKTARAIVDVDSSTLQAGNDVVLSAAVSVDAETPTLLPFATVDTTAEAAVTVRGNSSLTAGGSATLASASNVKARAVADLPDVVALPADAGVAVVLADS